MLSKLIWNFDFKWKDYFKKKNIKNNFKIFVLFNEDIIFYNNKKIKLNILNSK